MAKQEQFSQKLINNLVQAVAVELHMLSPNYEWSVASSTEGSMLYFYVEDLSGTSGHVHALHTKEVQSAPNLKKFLTIPQGEYLERYKLRVAFKDIFEGDRDPRGNPIALT